MKKYTLTLITVLETDDLDLMKQDLEDMRFGKILEIDTIINQGPILFEETHKHNRDTTTHISIESR